MTIRATQWTRRHFSQAMASAAAAAVLVRKLPAQQAGLACVTHPGGIQVFRATASRWTLLHETAAASPSHIVLHPSLPVLYVLHDVAQWENLPRGAVSTSRIHAGNGTLTHLGTQPLSLSATHPRHAVLTADSRALFVAAHAGGIYNQLPIAPDGTLQPVSAIRKEYGVGDAGSSKTATPLATARHCDGSIFTADPGQETISRFHLTPAGIAVKHRTRVHAGSGPSQMLLSPNGRNVYVMHAGSGAIAHHTIGATGLSTQQQLVPSSGGEMLLHPSGRFLLIAGTNGTQVLRIHPGTGAMAPHRNAAHANLRSLHVTHHGDALIALQANSVVSIPFDSITGELGPATTLATVANGATLHHTA